MGDYQLLHEKRKKVGKVYVKHRRVDPRMPLEVIEMDIKFQWVVSHQCYAFILTDLEQHLKGFYKTYNEIRLHGSLDHLPPKRFWALCQEGLIESIERKNKARRHRLLIPHYKLSGNGSQKEHSAVQK